MGDWGARDPKEGGVDRRGRGRTDLVGAKAGKEGSDIPGIREGESFEGAVMV